MADLKTMKSERRLPDFSLSWPSWRWFDDVFRDVDWRPPFRVEEYQEHGQMVVRAELPGIDPDKDVTVEIVDGDLVISAEKRNHEETTERHVHRSEFRYGLLTRRVSLPEGVDQSKISASYKDGVLEVRMPMPAEKIETGARKIEIQRG